MKNFPTTTKKAKEFKYGANEANPEGFKYNPKNCAYEIYENGLNIRQCSFEKGCGKNKLFCEVHAEESYD